MLYYIGRKLRRHTAFILNQRVIYTSIPSEIPPNCPKLAHKVQEPALEVAYTDNDKVITIFGEEYHA